MLPSILAIRRLAAHGPNRPQQNWAERAGLWPLTLWQSRGFHGSRWTYDDGCSDGLAQDMVRQMIVLQGDASPLHAMWMSPCPGMGSLIASPFNRPWVSMLSSAQCLQLEQNDGHKQGQGAWHLVIDTMVTSWACPRWHVAVQDAMHIPTECAKLVATEGFCLCSRAGVAMVDTPPPCPRA